MVSSRLGWMMRDRSPAGRVSDVYGPQDGMCGECKATADASRSLKSDEIIKIRDESWSAGAFDYAIFTQMLNSDGETLNLVTIDFEKFVEFIEISREYKKLKDEERR